jgi:hypothetical protein
MFIFCVNGKFDLRKNSANPTLSFSPFSKTLSLDFFFDSIAFFFLLSTFLQNHFFTNFLCSFFNLCNLRKK